MDSANKTDFASKDSPEAGKRMTENIWLGSLNPLNPSLVCLVFQPVFYFA